MISDPDLDLAINAAKRAGDILESEFYQGSRIQSQHGKDIKLAADVHAETEILGYLRAGSTYPVLSEESGPDANLVLTGLHWVVDPLDGTFNFSRGIPIWCISIALWNGDLPILGVIHEPISRRLYTGLVGSGAWLNERAIKVSEVAEVENAALSTGFPVGRNFECGAISQFVDQISQFKKIRLFGSAAISLAMVASGSIEAYQEEDIQYWDVAAGLALVKAAGGCFSVEPGSSRWQRNVLAMNARLQINSSKSLPKSL